MSSNTPSKLETRIANSSFLRMLCLQIPRKIKNRTILRFFDLLRHFHRKSASTYQTHEHVNRDAFKRHLMCIEQAGGYIEDQSNYEDMAYGKATVRYSGCEIIAVYNALTQLHTKLTPSLPDLISHFERDGIVLRGTFGTSPRAISDYFIAHGFKVETTFHQREFARIADDHATLILTMYNNGENLLDKIHTIFISHDEDGYTAHNVYGNGHLVGPYSTWLDLLQNLNAGKARGIFLIGIKHN